MATIPGYVAKVIGSSQSIGDTNSVTERYIYVRDRATNDGTIPLPSDLGLPAVGTKMGNLRLSVWTISEDASTGAVSYEATYELPPENEVTDAEDETITYRIESRGWRGTSVDFPLAYDVENGQAVVLPTGEPFSDVPNGSRAGAVFHQTYLSPNKSGAMNATCTVNKSAITIDGVTIPARCGRLTVSEEEIKPEEGSIYRYRVSVEVEVRHNYVKLEPGGNELDIGHDVALLLQGYKYKGKVKDKYGTEVDALIPFLESDAKGGTKPATTPGFLMPDGTRLANPSPTNCYYMRVASIKGAEWNANWFR